MQKTKFSSYKVNNLSKGCKLCVQGKKSVFFITGICPENCFYCPLSEKKFKKDVIYINEWPTKDWRNIKKEITLCKSSGIGITGGDPLAKLNRTITYIKKLKKEFGKNFHIHLYTPLTLVTKSTLSKLNQAGLDEIRFHPNLEDKKNWKKILLAKDFNWKIGIEIPIIPGKEKITKELIDNYSSSLDFFNLNEFEYSDTNAMKLNLQNYHTKNTLSYAIKGSQDLALSLLEYIEKNYPKLNVHYCTAQLKDKIQMKNRIKKRASSIKKNFDKITKDGTLIRGAIYLAELLPTKKQKIRKQRKKIILKKLNALKRAIEGDFKLHLYLDKNGLRLLTSEKNVKNLSKKISPKLFKLAVIEEYPTFDAFIVEMDFLS